MIDDLTRHTAAYGEMAKFLSKPESDTGLSLHGPLFERFAQVGSFRLSENVWNWVICGMTGRLPLPIYE